MSHETVYSDYFLSEVSEYNRGLVRFGHQVHPQVFIQFIVTLQSERQLFSFCSERKSFIFILSSFMETFDASDQINLTDSDLQTHCV